MGMEPLDGRSVSDGEDAGEASTSIAFGLRWTEVRSSA